MAGVQAIYIGLGTSLLVGVPCMFYAPKLLELMGASPQVVMAGSGYARIASGRLRSDRDAVPEQRDFSRGGRCSRGDAAVVGVEHH